MGITDKLAALIPRPGTGQQRQQGEGSRDAALALHDDFDRWLQAFVRDPFAGGGGDGLGVPSAELRETDDGVEVRAELPGLDPEDIDVRISGDGLTIRGETRQERRDERGSAECRYGRFEEYVALPPGVDVSRAEARVRNGVLVVRLPRAGARSSARRIPVQA